MAENITFYPEQSEHIFSENLSEYISKTNATLQDYYNQVFKNVLLQNQNFKTPLNVSSGFDKKLKSFTRYESPLIRNSKVSSQMEKKKYNSIFVNNIIDRIIIDKKSPQMINDSSLIPFQQNRIIQKIKQKTYYLKQGNVNYNQRKFQSFDQGNNSQDQKLFQYINHLSNPQTNNSISDIDQHQNYSRLQETLDLSLKKLKIKQLEQANKKKLQDLNSTSYKQKPRSIWLFDHILEKIDRKEEQQEKQQQEKEQEKQNQSLRYAQHQQQLLHNHNYQQKKQDKSYELQRSDNLQKEVDSQSSQQQHGMNTIKTISENNQYNQNQLIQLQKLNLKSLELDQKFIRPMHTSENSTKNQINEKIQHNQKSRLQNYLSHRQKQKFRYESPNIIEKNDFYSQQKKQINLSNLLPPTRHKRQTTSDQQTQLQKQGQEQSKFQQLGDKSVDSTILGYVLNDCEQTISNKKTKKQMEQKRIKAQNDELKLDNVLQFTDYNKNLALQAIKDEEFFYDIVHDQDIFNQSEIKKIIRDFKFNFGIKAQIQKKKQVQIDNIVGRQKQKQISHNINKVEKI